jgi:protein-S-isoprenylcysteine O-methyltransferase Ste14
VHKALSLADVPPVWLVGFAALTWIVGHLWPVAVPFGGFAGWALILAGVTSAVAAIAEMRRSRTTIIPRQDPSALVTSGLFRFSRNPIYLGAALVLAGLAILWHAPAALILVPVFVAVITKRFILGEESRLRTAFGPAFDAYAAGTRRWL